jgi:hypothetical protein
MAADVAYDIYELKHEHTVGELPSQYFKSSIGECSYDPYGKLSSIFSAFGIEVIWDKMGRVIHTPILTEEEWIEWIGAIANDAK